MKIPDSEEAFKTVNHQGNKSLSEELSDTVKKMIAENKGKEMIDARKLSLIEWLNLLTPDNIEKYTFVYWSFPTNQMKNEYLSSIDQRSDVEVKDLIRNFLIPTGSLYKDEMALRILLYSAEHDQERFKELMQLEFFRRTSEISPFQ